MGRVGLRGVPDSPRSAPNPRPNDETQPMKNKPKGEQTRAAVTKLPKPGKTEKASDSARGKRTVAQKPDRPLAGSHHLSDRGVAVPDRLGHSVLCPGPLPSCCESGAGAGPSRGCRSSQLRPGARGEGAGSWGRVSCSNTPPGPSESWGPKESHLGVVPGTPELLGNQHTAGRQAGAQSYPRPR